MWETVGGEVLQSNKLVCLSTISKGEGETKEPIGHSGNNWEIKNNTCIPPDRKLIRKINSDYIRYHHFNSIYFIFMAIFRPFIYTCENVHNLVRRQCIRISHKGVVMNFCSCVIYMYTPKLCFILTCSRTCSWHVSGWETMHRKIFKYMYMDWWDTVYLNFWHIEICIDLSLSILH